MTNLALLSHGLQKAASELEELHLTIPCMTEPSMLEKLLRPFAHLHHLGIYQFTVAAAWCWPATMVSYFFLL